MRGELGPEDIRLIAVVAVTLIMRYAAYFR